jgi:hypothetical protein
VFKLDPANQENVLHNFTGGTDGGFPTAGLILDGANLYGTATCGGIRPCSGGVGGDGVIFDQPLSGTYTVLHTFTGGDGANPNAGLVLSLKGFLYGTTFAGGLTGCNVSGTKGCGVVFKLQPVTRSYSRVYTFKGGADGANPYAGVVLGAGLEVEHAEPPKKGGCIGACGVTIDGGTSGNGVAYQVTPVQ